METSHTWRRSRTRWALGGTESRRRAGELWHRPVLTGVPLAGPVGACSFIRSSVRHGAGTWKRGHAKSSDITVPPAYACFTGVPSSSPHDDPERQLPLVFPFTREDIEAEISQDPREGLLHFMADLRLAPSLSPVGSLVLGPCCHQPHSALRSRNQQSHFRARTWFSRTIMQFLLLLTSVLYNFQAHTALSILTRMG